MKKGFTLVELTAVIIILGVLALITYPIIDKSIKNSKQKALEIAKYMVSHPEDDGKLLVEKLINELEHDEKEMFKMDRVLQRAKDMGIKFDKEYDEHEFYVTVLMSYTDYKKTIGKGNMEGSLSLAKEFLEDEDSPIKGGEKLAVYYDEIVNYWKSYGYFWIL